MIMIVTMIILWMFNVNLEMNNRNSLEALWFVISVFE